MIFKLPLWTALYIGFLAGIAANCVFPGNLAVVLIVAFFVALFVQWFFSTV